MYFDDAVFEQLEYCFVYEYFVFEQLTCCFVYEDFVFFELRNFWTLYIYPTIANHRKAISP